MIIDFGTTGVPATKEFAKRITWVDAPVSGGQVGAEAGDLTIMAGGTEAAFQRALPILQAVGQRITHLGPAGSGQVTKLANQLIVAQTIDAVAQALRLAELAGLDSALVREALLGGFAESRILDLHGDRMVRRDFAPGGRSDPAAQGCAPDLRTGGVARLQVTDPGQLPRAVGNVCARARAAASWITRGCSRFMSEE